MEYIITAQLQAWCHWVVPYYLEDIWIFLMWNYIISWCSGVFYVGKYDKDGVTNSYYVMVSSTLHNSGRSIVPVGMPIK